MVLLVFAFIVVPIVELYVIIQVGQAIGVAPTIALLIADSVLGALLLRHQGRGAWRRFNLALSEGRVPGREVFDGALVIFGAALLLTPGFVTDVFGLFLLLPPTRAAARTWLTAIFKRRVGVGATFWTVVRPGSGAANGRPYDVDGSAHEVHEPAPRLPPPKSNG